MIWGGEKGKATSDTETEAMCAVRQVNAPYQSRLCDRRYGPPCLLQIPVDFPSGTGISGGRNDSSSLLQNHDAPKDHRSSRQIHHWTAHRQTDRCYCPMATTAALRRRHHGVAEPSPSLRPHRLRQDGFGTGGRLKLIGLLFIAYDATTLSKASSKGNNAQNMINVLQSQHDKHKKLKLFFFITYHYNFVVG